MDWWTYYQIKSLFEQDKKSFGFQCQLTDLETIWRKGEGKSISKIYKWLLKWETLDEQIKAQMIKWAININPDIEFEEWEYLWNKSLKISTSSIVQENCYKMLFRWHLTPKKLSMIYKGMSNRCWKCNLQVWTFYHQWWMWPQVKKYWRCIHNKIQKILKDRIPKRPELFLLGIGLRKIRKEDRTMLWYMLAAARIVLANFGNKVKYQINQNGWKR